MSRPRRRRVAEPPTVLVLSGLAVVLVVVVLVSVSLNPWTAVALPTALLSVAAIIRAVRGTGNTDPAEPPQQD